MHEMEGIQKNFLCNFFTLGWMFGVEFFQWYGRYTTGVRQDLRKGSEIFLQEISKNDGQTMQDSGEDILIRK